jgi:two-component system CheB/CheR fusion protein
MPTRKKNAPPPNGASLKKVKEDKKPGDVESFPIVGIGASAGGLETLNVFFSAMPPDTQHRLRGHSAPEPPA